MGKDYPFPRPAVCPVCGSNKLWSHGYVVRYLFHTNGVYMKRFRCIICKSIHTLKPKGVLPYHQLPINELYGHICFFNKHKRYDTSRCSHQRQRHWSKSLQKNILIHLGFSVTDLVTGFERLLAMGLDPLRRPK